MVHTLRRDRLPALPCDLLSNSLKHCMVFPLRGDRDVRLSIFYPPGDKCFFDSDAWSVPTTHHRRSVSTVRQGLVGVGDAVVDFAERSVKSARNVAASNPRSATACLEQILPKTAPQKFVSSIA